jgi:transposase
MLSNYEKTDLVYIDEAGIDSNESYPYGWSEKGKRAWSKKPGNRQRRINFIGALKEKKFTAPLMFNGYCDSKLFEVYVEKCLLPELREGNIVIADNAAFHKSLKARKMIESSNCKLIFLPAYSPDLNPIEHEWFPIKNAIRKLLDEGESLEVATAKVLKEKSESIC